MSYTINRMQHDEKHKKLFNTQHFQRFMDNFRHRYQPQFQLPLRQHLGKVSCCKFGY